MRNESGLPPGLRVMLAEDEPLIALDAKGTLEALGVADVVWVRSVAEGLNILATQTFQAAFLDLKLGPDSSIPLAQRLSALGIPFSFLTGYQGDAIPPEHRAVPVVPKPFTASQLGDQLRTLVALPRPAGPGI